MLVAMKAAGPSIKAIHVRLRCQVHHRIRLVLTEYPLQCRAVANIHLFKSIAVAGTDLRQRLEVAGIGQFVDVDHLPAVLRIRCRTTAEPIKPAPSVISSFLITDFITA